MRQGQRWLVGLVGILILFQTTRMPAQNGNGNSVQTRLDALEAKVAALETAGSERRLCFDLIVDSAPAPIATPLFVGRVVLSDVPQGNSGFHKFAGAAINWESGGSSFTSPFSFDPLFGSAFAMSNGNLRFGFFVNTEAALYQEVRGTLTAPGFQTGSFSLRSTNQDDSNPTNTQDYFGHIATAPCTALP